MEEKIQKLFSFFQNIKNQPFYTSVISQIIEVYEVSSESLKFILYNLNYLIFSSSKQSRLRLKHRQICASLISKLNKIYVRRMHCFIEGQGIMELENFQLDIKGAPKHEGKYSNLKWFQLDLFHIIEDERLLLATQKGRAQIDQIDYAEEQNKIFDEFIDMKHATMLNLEDLFKDVECYNEVTDEAYKTNKKKYGNKIEKFKQKNETKINQLQLVISNPFNLMLDICIDNFLHPQWELRHLSVLILKELLLHSEFLGFSFSISMKKHQLEKRFSFLNESCKQMLIRHLKQSDIRNQIFQEITTQCLILLSLDRFADYQTDESVIIVRQVAASILVLCFIRLSGEQQSKLLKILKRIFDRQCSFNNNNKFTWQVKHSFIYFIWLLTDNSQFHKIIFKYLEQPFIKMLTNTQTDQIILCICKCFSRFVGQSFFQEKAIDRINEQIWIIVEHLDDISISTKHALKLLRDMFPYYKLNEMSSLQKIKKLFTSKIPEVRQELYHLLTCLYSRKANFNQKNKIVEINLIQFMQAVIVESDTAIFQNLMKLSPHIFYYIKKQRKIRKVIDFVHHSVVSYELTREIIQNKFKIEVDEDKTSGNKEINDQNNDYLFFCEHENIGVSTTVYIDKRIWKVSKVLIEAFKVHIDCVEQFVRGLRKQSEKDDRAKLLLLLVMCKLMLIVKPKIKIFNQYQVIAKQILKTEFYEVTDPGIEILKNQFSHWLLKNVNKQSEDYAIFKPIQAEYQKIKSNRSSLMNIYQQLKTYYNDQSLKQEIRDQIKYLISTILAINQAQKQLLKNMKILSTHYLIHSCTFQQIQCLKTVIKNIQESVRTDYYSFISDITAQAMIGLSKMLMSNNKKNIYAKFNTNVLNNVANSYSITTLILREHVAGVNLEGKFMNAICLYIESIGVQHPNWLNDFTDCFIEQFQIETNIRNSKLYILSGTIISLLKIDQKGQFLQKLVNKLNPILKCNDDINHELLLRIIKSILLSVCENYTSISNLFLLWFIKQMQKGQLILFKVMQMVFCENLVILSAVSSIFILVVVKSMTKPELQKIAMNSLSDVIVGVYINNRIINFSAELKKKSLEGIQFIKNFKDSSKFKYNIKVALHKQIQLRNYQEEGICWLGFLTKYNLNGALCDDMGLGKTLQILTHIENEYYSMQEENALSSMIVVPTTLVQHWSYEYSKYFIKPICKVVKISSTKYLPQKVSFYQPELIIINYSTLQKCIDKFSKQQFKFLILDEGHAIKNTKTNRFKAIVQLKAQHRFILTGTPIQNRLKQLWGLFQFLMPGYLYSEEVFNKVYEKLFEVNLTTFHENQLLFSQDQKKVLQKLHFKVMPFIMRRMKSDVMKQLPEKLINDYYCEMTTLQSELYQNFQKLEIKEQMIKEEKNVLASLSQMRKILNHPMLVGQNCKWNDSGKFIALEELFSQLGLDDQDSLLHSKIIIFSRFTATIDLLEENFMKSQFPLIKYLKLTGNTRIGDRFNIAQTFNGDIDIRVLLVTTTVGGEGLNLSAANTVIMFDHDYNPTVDMQAIDRAHRIGQKQILNVYRLITKNTLEQKIMGIQKFKTSLATAIVNIDNASIKNIQESKLPELLENLRDIEKNSKDDKVQKSMYKSMLEEMEKNAIQTEEFSKKF